MAAAQDDTVLRLCGCRQVIDGQLVEQDLFVQDGKIVDPEKLFFDQKRVADLMYDCTGLIVAPGFIDLQINGGFGVDFSSTCDNVSERLQDVSNKLLQYGVTSFCPTLVTSSSTVYKEILPQVKVSLKSSSGANVLGVHLEGPFINVSKKGAHNAAFIRSSMTPDEVERCYGDLGVVRIITLAPELPGAMETIQWLTQEKDIVVSLGHSMCNLETAVKAVHNGASFVTHLFNAMLPFHHRDPGLVGLLTSLNMERTVHCGLIADNLHTHPTVTRIAHNANPKGIVLVSDAIGAMGLSDGIHQLSDMSVEVCDGKVQLEGTDTLAGSVATMDLCVRTFKEATSCSIAEALEAASLHPAATVGVSHCKGRLKFGYDADLVVLDKDLHVVATFLAGRKVWNREESGLRLKSWGEHFHD